MNAITVAIVNFLFVFGAALVGMFLSTVLPEEHLSPEGKESIKLTVGLVATMASLLLGLLIASAKSTFDVQQNRVIEMAALVTIVDRSLSIFGPDSVAARKLLQEAIAEAIERLWPSGRSSKADLKPIAKAGDELYRVIQGLEPDDAGRSRAKELALESATGTARLYTLLYAQATMGISRILIAIVISWLIVIFHGFGLLAAKSATMIVALIIAAIAVSTAVFLVVELDSSFGGIIGVSGDPLRKAHQELGD